MNINRLKEIKWRNWPKTTVVDINSKGFLERRESCLRHFQGSSVTRKETWRGYTLISVYLLAISILATPSPPSVVKVLGPNTDLGIGSWERKRVGLLYIINSERMLSQNVKIEGCFKFLEERRDALKKGVCYLLLVSWNKRNERRGVLRWLFQRKLY